MESHFNIVECQSNNKGPCRVAPVCSLKSVLHDALEQFLSHLDEYTLADDTRPNAGLALLNKSPMRVLRSSRN